MTLTYYTYTQGETLQKALNAIAAFFQSSDFNSLISISMMVGTVMTLLYFMTSRNVKHIYIWAAVFVLVPMTLIKQTARVQIHDLTEPGGVYSVDNVPYIVALPTWAFSTLMVGLTEPIEAIFTTTDDERYGRTGMMFGSEMYQLSRQSNLRNVEFRDQWNNFFRNCIIGDIEINRKYTWDELSQSPDILGFLDSKKMSPLRGVIYRNGDYKTCENAYPEIEKGFTAAATQDLDLLGTYLYGKKASEYKTHVSNALSNSNSKFLGISMSAEDITKQNMAINAMRFSINTLNPTANALNYAYTQNKMQQTSMWASLGLQAREFIPMMHTMMFFLFSCLSFFIAAAAMIPSLTKLVLTNYVKTFAYLATWPALFAILNAIMLWTLESSSTATANIFNGLTLKNSNALDELHTRFAYMTGFLMMTIPILASKILSGGAAAIQGMNYQLASMINSTNARVSAAAASGNMDFGNMQVGNHSYNNTSANKFDDNMVLRTGVASVQQPDGSMTNTYLNDGNRQTFQSQDIISKATWAPQMQSTLTNSVNDQYSQAQMAQQQNMTSLNEAFSVSNNISDRWNDSWSKNDSYGYGHNLSTEGQISQSYNKMDSAINSVTETTGWTEDESRSYVQAVNAGLKVGTPEFFKMASASAGVNWSNESRESFSHMTAEQEQSLKQASAQYSEGATDMTRAGMQLDTKENRSDVEQYANDFAINQNNVSGLSAAVNKSNAEMDNLSHIQSRLESDSASFNASTMPGFQRYLENENYNDSEELQRLMTATSPEAVQEVRGHYEEYTRSDAFKNDYGVNTTTSYLDDLQSLYQPNDLSTPPQLTPGQTSMMSEGVATAQQKTNETIHDLIDIRGSDNLYDSGTFRDIRGNAAVWGGDYQNQVINNPEADSVRDPNHEQSELVRNTEREIQGRGEKSPDIPDTGYENYPLKGTNPSTFKEH